MKRSLHTIAAIVALALTTVVPASADPGRTADLPDVVPGQIIVGVETGGSIDSIARSLGASGITPLLSGDAYVVRVPGDPFGNAARARGLSGVEYAEPDFIRTLHDAPDDGGWTLKWDLHNDGTHGTADADVDWLEAYEHISANGLPLDNVTVAVLDTGVDFGHPDLDAKLVAGFDFVNGDGDPTDGYGHGTHVSGIVAGETNNGGEDPLADTASIGYDSAIRVMPIQVCSDTGSCPSSAIANGITYAADNGAWVINMSLGGASISQAEMDAIDYAWGQGVLIIASAGNDNSQTQSYPAAYEPVVAVAATNSDDQKADYSNYGASWVDITAPGGEMVSYHDPGGIYSTMPGYQVYLTECVTTGPPWVQRPCYEPDYDQLQGTSMSAPQVAGAAALLFALDSTLSNSDVRSHLQTTADPISGTGSLWANGRLNVYSAVLAVAGGSSDNTAPVAGDDSATTDEDVAVTIDVLANDSDADGDALSVASVTQGSNGSVTNNGSDVTYTPHPDFNGSDSFTYTVSDGNGGSDSATVSITVDPVNDAPVAQDDSASTQVDNAVTIFVLANDSDVDGDVLSVSALETIDAAANGTVTTDGTSVTYTPNLGFTGTDTFSYTASDGTSSDTAIVTVTVSDAAEELTVTGIDPNSVTAGGAVEVTISGTGFVDGATVALENGSGPTPDVSNVTWVDSSTLTATISTRSNGPPRNRVWDVRVTNPDSSTAVLSGGFTVIV